MYGLGWDFGCNEGIEWVLGVGTKEVSLYVHGPGVLGSLLLRSTYFMVRAGPLDASSQSGYYEELSHSGCEQ